MTEVHDSVVIAAQRNVVAATQKSPGPVRAVARNTHASSGNLTLPLKGQEGFDLIYENMPNIPPAAIGSLDDGQKPSTFVGDRSANEVPAHVSEALLDLHYVCLYWAKVMGLIRPFGAILSSMGSRAPVQSMLDIADAAGYSVRDVLLLWKIWGEPETVIGKYARYEKDGSRKLMWFFFYHTSDLSTVFRDHGPANAALHASQIEENLRPHHLDAVTALQKHHAGFEIGHTVYVVASVLKRESGFD